MPEISRFYGIIIRMLYNDTVQHYKPHIHVSAGDDEASVALDGEILAGSLTDKKYALLKAWIVIHEEELYKAWNKAVRGEPFGKIEPLK